MFLAGLAFVDDPNIERHQVVLQILNFLQKTLQTKVKNLLIVVKHGVVLATRFNRNHNCNSKMFDTFVHNAPIVCF